MKVEAEQSVLGSILVDDSGIPEAMDALKPEDFWAPAHRIIWKTVEAMFSAGRPVDVLTVSDALAESGKLEDAGGYQYLAALMESVPSVVNVPAYAGIVRAKSSRRRLSSIGERLAAEAERTQDFESVAAGAVKDILSLCDIKRGGPVNSQKLVSLALASMESSKSGRMIGVTTGLADLDKNTQGFCPGTLTLIGARPGVGKTALALNMATAAAIDGAKALFFSLEMSGEQLARRLLAQSSGVNLMAIRSGNLTEKEKILVTRKAGSIPEFLVDETPALTELDIRIRTMMHRPDIVFVDYLQLVCPSDRKLHREQQINQIAWQLKTVAKECSIPVVALTQLNRKIEERNDKTPKLSDLRESGALEQHADNVLFIHREDSGESSILIEKQRDGWTGEIGVYWDAPSTSFRNLSKEGR